MCKRGENCLVLWPNSLCRQLVTMDLLNIGLGDLWQAPILDRTLGPVTCDCLIDWNGTVNTMLSHLHKLLLSFIISRNVALCCNLSAECNFHTDWCWHLFVEFIRDDIQRLLCELAQQSKTGYQVTITQTLPSCMIDETHSLKLSPKFSISVLVCYCVLSQSPVDLQKINRVREFTGDELHIHHDETYIDVGTDDQISYSIKVFFNLSKIHAKFDSFTSTITFLVRLRCGNWKGLDS